MASERTLGILSGIAQGADKLTTNLYNIMQAKEESRRDRELFDIKKKKAKLDLQASEAELDPETLDLKKRKLQGEVKNTELLMDARDLNIRKTEGDLRQKTLLNFLAGVKQFDDLNTEQASYISNIGGGGVDVESPTFDEETFTESLRGSLGISQEEAGRELLGVAGSSKTKEPNKVTKDYLKDFTSLALDQEEALGMLEEDINELEVKGADIDLIRERINFLPKKVADTGEQGAFDRILQGLGTLSRFFLKRSE